MAFSDTVFALMGLGDRQRRQALAVSEFQIAGLLWLC